MQSHDSTAIKYFSKIVICQGIKPIVASKISMTSTELEKLRQQYQDIEEKRKAAVRLLMNPPKTVKEEAYVLHHEARYCREISDLSRSILTTITGGFSRAADPISGFYADLERRIDFHQTVADRENKAADTAKDDNSELGSMNDLVLDIKGATHLSLFYDNERYQEWRRVKKEKDSKKKKKRRVVVPETDEALTKFSGEECFGQFLDLCELHRSFLALVRQTRISYLEFLLMFHDAKNLDFIPSSQQGQQFVVSFIEYLKSFITRSDPFFDIKSCLAAISQSFLRQYRDDKPETVENSDNYCAYCDKSFQSQELYQAHLKQKSHRRNENKANKLGGIESLIEERKQKKKNMEELKFTLLQLLDRVRKKFENTIENTKRRQTLSAAVMEAEANLDAPIVFDESDEEDNQHFYNPKGLPLGWDGKPIPYWLYKLHGLSVEYKCEICGNKSYWGSLAFERHFFDNCHANGLKAIGIPPTRHFLYVTGVNEALALYDKIKKSLNQEVWQKGDEEIETEDGQVLSYKIYRDLTKQGIIKQKAITKS